MKHIYVAIQFICLGLLAWLGKVLVIDLLSMLQALGASIGIWAIASVGQNHVSIYPTPNEGSSLSAKGIYQWIRHPMYTSIFIFFLPVAIRTASVAVWIIYAILCLTLIFKIGYEEKQLIKKHPEYQEFMKTTRYKLFPWIW